MATNREPELDDKNPAGLATFCRSFASTAELEAIEPLGDTALAILKDTGGDLAKSKPALIEAVRAGKHVELKTRAITFRQKDGSPNKNYLRFKSSKLGDIASSFAGKPFLVDHNKWSQSARKGTILSSEGVPLAGGWFGFRQVLHVVKPDAVISVLDGTIDAFSIGWDPRGEVRCTAHNVDVRSRKSCYWTEGCYPGKLVEVDGEKRIAEYEWQSTEGLEVSGVNTPAVSGTKIENIAALAAELGLTRPAHTEPARKDRPMSRFALLFAALAIPAKRQSELADLDDDKLDARLAETVTELRGELSAANEEKSAAIKRAELAEKSSGDVAAQLAELAKLKAAQIDSVLEIKGYRAGKLIRGKDKDGKNVPSAREARLRRIAKEDGLEAMEAELAELEVVAKVGAPVLTEDDPNPRPSLTASEIPGNVLASTAKQLGLTVEELSEHHAKLTGRSSGDN